MTLKAKNYMCIRDSGLWMMTRRGSLAKYQDRVLAKLSLISGWSVGCLALSCKGLDSLPFPRLGETLFLLTPSLTPTMSQHNARGYQWKNYTEQGLS